MGGVTRPLPLRLALAAAAALTLAAPAHATAAGVPSPSPQASQRSHLLARSGHGQAVVDALGDKLPAAAATNRMSSTALRSVLENDPTAWLGQDGQLFYVEKAEALGATTGLTAGAATATYPEADTFALHSLPGSNHTIYLDFRGGTVSGTWWNTASGGMPARYYTGFTLDSDPTTFSSAELAYIQQVWRIVAEKYAPFDVDVTTQDPGPDAYNRSSALDQTYGDHVMITDDAGAVTSACSNNCSGIALMDTFDNTSDNTGYLEPAWVFSSMTSHSAVLTAHTVAHEVGHTFGLLHDGVTGGSAYYSGQGNWFPIMGSGVKGVGQFSQGEYTAANNTQDDLAVIAANGAPLRPDDHSDGTVLAEPLAPGGVVSGVIGTRTDTDVFAVNHNCTTNLTARATGIGAGASLDMSVTVTDALGNVVGSANPPSGQTSSWPALPTGMDAQVTVPAGVGTYYVRIDGVGNGDPATTGYSDYGSVGEYVLAISACDGTIPPVTTPVAPTGVTTTTTTTRAGLPSMPGIGLASSGRPGGTVTATVRWRSPASNGGAAIVGYRIKAERLARSGRVARVLTSAMVSAGQQALTMHLPRGHYRFRIVALNPVGASPMSAASRAVIAR